MSVKTAVLLDMEGLEAYVSNVNSPVQNAQQVQRCVLPALKLMEKHSSLDLHVCKSAPWASTLIQLRTNVKDVVQAVKNVTQKIREFVLDAEVAS